MGCTIIGYKGDFVVFKYISKLCLKVQIFEKSGCEKDISAQKTNIDLDERCPDQPMLLIDLVCDEEKNDKAEPAPENRRRKKKRKSKLLGKQKFSPEVLNLLNL